MRLELALNEVKGAGAKGRRHFAPIYCVIRAFATRIPRRHVDLLPKQIGTHPFGLDHHSPLGILPSRGGMREAHRAGRTPTLAARIA